MKFHTPFYRLRRRRPKQYCRDRVHTKPSRQRVDLSFLISECYIQEAQVSFTICGIAESCWVAYGFFDTDPDEDEQMSEDEFSDVIRPDMIADGEADANYPIWSPREYFLLIVRRRLEQIVREWINLVATIESSMIEYSIGPCTEGSLLLHKVTKSRTQEYGDTKSMLKWTEKTLVLLRRILRRLSKTSSACERFASANGDISYFIDEKRVGKASQEHIRVALLAIKDLFEDLKDLQERLQSVEQLCRNSANILESRLIIESNRVATPKGHALWNMNRIITPVAIVGATFGVQQEVFSFPQNKTSFILSLFAAIIIIALSQLLILFEECISLWRRSSKQIASMLIKEQIEALVNDLISKGRHSQKSAQSTQANNFWMREDIVSVQEEMKGAKGSTLYEAVMTETGMPTDVAFNSEAQVDLNAPKEMLSTPYIDCEAESSHKQDEPHFFKEIENIDDMGSKNIQNRLPESWIWDVDYRKAHGNSSRERGYWTCTPIKSDDPKNFPLTIANRPVVLPVEYRWPPMAGVNPPPDLLPSTPIDCSAKLPLDLIRDIFLTFKGSIGFYLLINELLQIITPRDFDTVWASSHLPHRYRGLKVCYIPQTVEPTVFTSKAIESKASQASETSRMLNIFRQSRQSTMSLDRSFHLNDFIEARAKSSPRKEKFAGRVGLKVTKHGYPYLTMSTHVIIEAILAKSHIAEIFGRNRDCFEKLDDDWNERVEIWAGNEKVNLHCLTANPIS